MQKNSKKENCRKNGSRFEVKGNIFNGPALSSLKPLN